MKIKKFVIKSQIKFSKNIAMRLIKIKTSYYKFMRENIRNLLNRDKEKQKYSTPRQKRVTSIIKKYKILLDIKSKRIFHVFKRI